MNYGLLSSVSINCFEKLAPYIKLNAAAATSTFALFTLAALIETVVRATLTILIKIFTFFIPAGTWKEADACAKFCAKSTLINAWGCAHFGYGITGAFLEKQRVQKASEAIQHTFNHPRLIRALKQFATVHITGFTSKEPPLSPAARALCVKNVMAPPSSQVWHQKLISYWG